jgi:hypothetical protein
VPPLDTTTATVQALAAPHEKMPTRNQLLVPYS